MKTEKLKKLFSSKVTKSLAVVLVVVLIGAAVFVNYKLFYDPVDAMGFGDNYVRLPLTTMEPENEEKMRALMREQGLNV